MAILNIFSDLIDEGLDIYMENFTPYGDDFDQALQKLEKVLERCISTRLCLSNEKCHMMITEGVILGHYIYVAGIQVDTEKIEVILLLATPCTQTEVRSFLGYAGYYHRFINNFSQIVVPLYALTRNVELHWSDKCDTSFSDLKKLVSTTPILRSPNLELPF